MLVETEWLRREFATITLHSGELPRAGLRKEIENSVSEIL